ncbi:MAG: condensation domain-containing protein, partial [Solirubrobacteraceae bacterium]
MSATIDGLPLSLTQQYFHDIILAEGFDPTWQHVSMTLQTGRRLEPGRVEEVVGRLAARHPLLATRLDYRHGEPVLRQAAGDRSVTVTLDLREASAEEFELRLTRAAEEPFDLLAGPLWRVVAAQGPDGSGALSFVGHHLVADAISTWIMFKDFGRLYFGEELDPPTEPYATFAADQHAMRDEPPQARLAYWEEQLDAAEPLLVATSRPSSSELAASAAMPLNPGPIDSRIVLARARATRVTPLALLTAITISGVR